MLRISHLVATTALLGGLAIAGMAAAAPKGGHMDGPPPPPPPFGGPIDFKAIDADGNGSLVRAELMARATDRISHADTNGDGALDRAELVAALPGPNETLVAVFSVSPSERMADRLLAETGNTESGKVTIEVLAARQVNMLLAAVDTDNDAAISQAEADAMRMPHGPGGPRGAGPDGPDGPGWKHDMRRGGLGLEQLFPAPAEPDSSADSNG